MVPTLQQRVEHDWYENSQVFRFENSDLFALGPLVSYLRQHPRGERPRIAFFGDSVMFGYGLEASTTIPARFQELQPSKKTFNLALNGSGLPS